MTKTIWNSSTVNISSYNAVGEFVAEDVFFLTAMADSDL